MQRGYSLLIIGILIITLSSILVVEIFSILEKNHFFENNKNLEDIRKAYSEKINESVNDLAEGINKSGENETVKSDESIDGISVPFVVRSFSAETVAPNEVIEVTLEVFISGGETYYLIEEYTLQGGVIIDDGGGTTKDPNRLAWAALNAFGFTEYINIIYKIKAPSTPGVYTFDGIYQFEGMNSSVTILGPTAITVD